MVCDAIPGAARESAWNTITSWPDHQPTALRSLDAMAAELGIAALHYKDESTRFGLESFKALGGAYAVQLVLQSAISDVVGKAITLEDVAEVRYPEAARSVTVVTATDGNHGRSVAWGAKRFGCECNIYMHEHVSRGRQEAVELHGARVQRVKGNYDDSVHAADADARSNGWRVVSDTSWPGYEEIPRTVMAGYTVMSTEAMNQWPHEEPPTHIFLQGGCGGMAAAVVVDVWCRYGAAKPRMVVVEPVTAACLYESAVANEQRRVDITVETVMAGLSCGEVSMIAWPVLVEAVEDFLTITDEPVGPLMQRLARDESIVAGESAVAGLAGLFEAQQRPNGSVELGLDEDSRVLVFGTEGATDPEVYRSFVT